MPRDVRQRRFALRDAVVLVGLAEQACAPGSCALALNTKLPGGAELSLPAGEGPAGDDARERRHVVLRVAAADAERMQLHDLAREIFVEPALAVLSGAEVRAERLLVVEKEQHRRMLLDRLQHVAEAAEHMRPDRLALERAAEPGNRAALDRDGEMVGPEDNKPLGERGSAIDRACMRAIASAR